MLKRIAISFFLLAALGGISQASSSEQVFKGEIWDNICAATGSHDAMMKKAGVDTPVKCSIGCAMTRGKYVLYAPGTKQVYQLDDQSHLLEFAGQKVVVKGSLDAATSTIHVSKIELQAKK
jgi:hypothetical protein